MNLTYSLIYTPNLKTMENNLPNFICFDKKIHFRFKDFNKEELLVGFEKKLTYLMSYLFHFTEFDDFKYAQNDVLNHFYKTDDVLMLYDIIKMNLSYVDSFKGFKAYTNYKRKTDSPTAIFGEVDKNCFPLDFKKDGYEISSLNIFLQILNIDLKNYLFNDAYAILIHKPLNKTINEKFIKKEIKKQNKLNDNVQYEQLW